MKIALISDTHDHLERVAQALAVLSEWGAEAMIHAGDIVSPFTAEKIAAFDGPIRAVFGNCDGEHEGLSRVLKSISSSPAVFELGGQSFVLGHDETRIPEGLLTRAQIVVVGHTHQPQQRRQGNTLIINPGECCGRISGQATVGLLETEDLSVEIVRLA